MSVEPSRPAVPGAPASEALDRTLVRGIAWTGGVRWTSQIVTWASTLVVARLLSPADYGLVGMAAVYFGFVTLVNEFGIGSSIVILRQLSRTQVAELNAMAALFGGGWLLASLLLADPIADFYGAPEVRGIVIAMSGVFLITAFRTVPYALLERDLRFRALALIEGGQAVLGAGVTVALALRGHGYWALVLGQLAGAALSTALALGVRPHGFARPRRVGAALRISWHILVGRLSWYVYSNADYLVAGKLLGKTALGFYSFAFTLASIPTNRVTALVAKVTPAFFATVQTDRPGLRRYFLNLTEGLALVTFPTTWGLALVAGEFVPLALGDKWMGAVLPLQVLALYAGFRCISPLLAHVLNVTGNTRFAMWVGLLSALVLPLGFLAGSRHGTVGIAAAWLVLHPLVTLPNFWLVFRTLELRPARYLRALWPALSASLVMAAAVWAARRQLPEDAALATRFVLEVAAGAVAYALALLVFHRGRLRAARATLRLLR